MLIRIITAALETTPLGAPGIVSISNDSSSATHGWSAGVSFSNAGRYYKYITGAPVDTSAWVDPVTDLSEYEIYATLDSGTTPTGTLTTWLPLDTSREWTLSTATVGGSVTCQLTMQIRWTGNNVVQDSATYTLSATGPTGGGGGGAGGGGGNEEPD
jgi:hypothetical protein